MTKEEKLFGVRAKFVKYKDDNQGSREITLDESGVVCQVPNFINHGRWMRAQRIASGDASKAQTAFVAESVLFEGEKLTLIDIQELVPAADMMQLVAEIFGGKDEGEDSDLGKDKAA